MTFNEHIVKRKKGKNAILLSLLIYSIATILALTIMVALVLIFPLPQIGTLLAAGCYYLAYRISTNMKKEFEYIFTQDSVTIDSIMNTSRRKRIIKFYASQLEILAPIEHSSYKQFENMHFNKTIDATSKSKIAIVYYAVVNDEDARILIKFEPPYSFVKDFYKYAPSKVILD